MLNTWMNSPSTALKGEMDVLQDLTDENIAAGGINVKYLPKTQLNMDQLFGESIKNVFEAGFEIEMYLDNVVNFNGDGDMFGKFGIMATDAATLIVSKRRFPIEAKVYNLLEPQQGDLIYMELSNTMWEIKKVKLDRNYYQFGKNYTFVIEVSLYTPSHDRFVDEEYQPLDFKETSQTSDDGLLELLGIDRNTAQDESDEIVKEANKTIIGDNFNPDNPFGGM